MPPPNSRAADWIEIAAEAAGIDAETVADAFRQHCPGGVAIEPTLKATDDGVAADGDGPALVRGYLPPGESSARVRRSLRLALRFAPLQRPLRWRRSRRLPEERWRDSWKRYFRPQRIGSGLVVRPSWSVYRPRAGEAVLEIDPGMAFGTGQHPTTAMCLRLMQDRIRRGDRVIDVGTGSGILAVAAAKLGAGLVVALDIDPQAVKAARKNATANAVQKVLEIREGTLPEGARGERFNLCLANISGVAIERLAAPLAGVLEDDGTLIASGFLEDAVNGLARVLGSSGLAVDEVQADGVWRAMVATRSRRA